MPVVFDEVRKLATIEKIDSIEPIEGADAIVKATVRGWTVVVKKDEFSVGENVIYFEEDTALPLDDERFCFLAPRGSKKDGDKEYHVLKIAKLRGVYSQGLILPIAMFLEEISKHFDTVVLTPGTDVTSILGLGKWEAPIPVSNGNAAGSFLTKYARKTDSERIQNLVKVWDVIKNNDWVATEKVDGTSCTVIRDENNVLRVCSRNFEVQEGDNTYWNLVKRYSHIFEILEPNMAIQLEVAGLGIQGNRLKLNDVRPFIFDVVDHGVMVPREKWKEEWLRYAAPVVDGFIMPETPQELIEMVDGMRSVVNPQVLAEGIVFHSRNGQTFNEIGGRNTFKVISQKYLLKN